MKKLYLIVPYFHKTVICSWDEVWLVTTTVVINAIHAFFMSLQSEVWWWWAQLPHLQRAIASASQHGAFISEGNSTTPLTVRNAKEQERSWRMLIFLTHLFGFFLTLLEFPGGRITMAFSEMPISRLYPKRLWFSGTTMKFRNLDYQQTPQVSWLWETLL